MTIDADALLAGPRGRRLCLEYALAGARPDIGEPLAQALSTVFWAEYALSKARPHSSVALFRVGDGPFEEPVVGAVEAASALSSIPLSAPTADLLLEALTASVDSAMYWQPPDTRDELAGSPELGERLREVADLIGAHVPAWWTASAALDDQWLVPWDAAPGLPYDTADLLDRWRADVAAEEERSARERPADPHANWTGTWWSTPPSGLAHSSRGLGDTGPAGLRLVEDSMGWDEATATPLAPAVARVLEIDGAAAWIDLCRRHPIDVTASRRQDWFRTTGRDGAWVLPDWAAIGRDWDAVHLSVAAYLEAAGRALDIGDGRAGVIAGWAPDETYWFSEPVTIGARAQTWRRVDETWARDAR